MKKSLSLVVAAAMTLTTASVAFADAATPTATDLTSQQKFDALKELGIFSGYPDGTAGLDKEMTRAEFAKVLTKLSQLEENASAASVYTDVPATHWAVGFVGAATEAKLMNGLGANKFGPSGQVTIEQIAKVADLVAGIDPIADAEVSGAVSGWAKGYVAAAVKAGLLPEMSSYQTNATRDLLVDVTYDLSQASQAVTVASTKVVDDKNIEVTFSDGGVVKKALDTALVAGTATKVSVDYNGKTYEVEVTLQAFKATGAKQSDGAAITVTFDRGLSDTEKAATTFAVKNETGSDVTMTATWAADNASVVLSKSVLPTGDYTVTPTGLDALNVTIADEVATKLEITTDSLQQIDGQDAGVKLYNQFGGEMDSDDVDVTVYDATLGEEVAAESDGTYNLAIQDENDDYVYSVDDNFVVSAVHAESGLSATKSFKLTAGSAATVMKFGTPTAPEGEARIATNQDGVVIPYTFTDQYGKAVTLGEDDIDLTAGEKVLSGITFLVSDTSIISGLSVDEDGVLTATTGDNSGTVVVNAVNSATGATAAVSFVVNSDGKIAKFTMSKPTDRAVVGSDISIPLSAVDSFGTAIDASDIDLDSDVKVYSTLDTNGDPYINGSGNLVFNFSETGTAVIIAYVDGAEVGRLSLKVYAKGDAKSISVDDENQYIEYNSATQKSAILTIDQGNVNITDTNGIVSDITSLDDFSYTNHDVFSVTEVDGNLAVSANGTGSTTITINDPESDLSVDYKVTAVATDKISSYKIDTIGSSDLLYDDDAGSVGQDSEYAKEVTLSGVYNGKGVSLIDADDADAANKTTLSFADSSDDAVLTSYTDDSGKVYVYGVEPGKATLKAYDQDGKVLASKDVTVSDAAPVVKSVSFLDADGNAEDQYDNFAAFTAVAGGTTINAASFGDLLSAKDQYDVAITPGSFQVISSNSDKVLVTKTASNTYTLTPAAKGYVTLTLRSSNGVTGTVTLVVNADEAVN